jgi:Arc/MetJ-type ribon-helix-helix transcriptional regulator
MGDSGGSSGNGGSGGVPDEVPGVVAHRSRAGNTGGMTTTYKIAVSLPKQVAERARRAIKRGSAASMSAYVSTALEEKIKMDDLSTLLAEMLEESGGALTAAERRAADRALGLTAKPARRTRRR